MGYLGCNGRRDCPGGCCGDASNNISDADVIAFGDEDLKDAVFLCFQFGCYFVRFQSDEYVSCVDSGSGFNVPGRDGGRCDGFTEVGDDDIAHERKDGKRLEGFTGVECGAEKALLGGLMQGFGTFCGARHGETSGVSEGGGEDPVETGTDVIPRSHVFRFFLAPAVIPDVFVGGQGVGEQFVVDGVELFDPDDKSVCDTVFPAIVHEVVEDLAGT